MVLVKKWPFFHVFFYRKYRPKKCFLRYSRTRKVPFYPIKTRSSESPKIEIFPKGLTHGLSQKGAMLFLKSEKKLNFFKGVR